MKPLYFSQYCLLEFSLNLLARLVGRRFTVKSEESTQIELGRLEELDLAYVDL
jgi:hypothetical protein